MQVERMPLDKLKQKKQVLEWQRDDYRSINTLLLGFRDKLTQLKLTPNYRARTASTSNDSRVTATATSGASQASYSISSVKQLATAATRVNTGKISIDPTKKLGDQQIELAGEPDSGGFNWKKGVVQTSSFRISEAGQNKLQLEGGTLADLQASSIKVNGKRLEVVIDGPDGEVVIPGKGQVKVDADGLLTFGDPLEKDSVIKVDYILNEKTVKHTSDVPLKSWSIGSGLITPTSVEIGGESYQINVADGIAQLGEIGTLNVVTGVITFADEDGLAPGTEIAVKFTQDYAAFNIESHTSKGKINEQFFVTSNDSLTSIIRKVNESDAGVTMLHDSFTGKMTLTRKETGDFNPDDSEGRKAEIVVGGAFIKNILNFDNDIGKENGGQNAIFTINGLDTERHSNTFEMSGVTFTIKQTFTALESEPITVTIGNDGGQVFDNIKAFVDQYNELIGEISKKLNEERHRSYHPLTDEEREGLSDKQEEKWEEMARSGLIKGDPILSSILTQMRLDMSSSVETGGLFNQLASIGIKTTANYLDGGKLEINEARLREAIENDPQAVENLFRGTGTTTSDRGVIHKIYDSVNATMTKLQDKAGRATSTNQQFALGRDLLNVDKGIDRFEQKMKTVEDRYWRQFTAMEMAIQRANEQSTYLMQQFSGF